MFSSSYFFVIRVGWCEIEKKSNLFVIVLARTDERNTGKGDGGRTTILQKRLLEAGAATGFSGGGGGRQEF